MQASAQDKVYKIRYCLNILPSMNLQNDKDLMEAIVNTEELAIFKTVALMSMADFKGLPMHLTHIRSDVGSISYTSFH